MDLMSVLKAESLTKKVTSPEGMLTIVNDVSLDIAAGESVAIVGASGAGKSTLLALLAGLDTPTSGRVILAGADLTALDEDGRARLRAERVGFVFQSFHLVPSLTALENVMLPLELDGIATSAARTEARHALERVGIVQQLDRYPDNFSGGQQQRIAIARAVVGDRRVLFADEPTGALDTLTSDQVVEVLATLARTGTAIVMVTHEPRFASWADRVVFLRDGRIVDDTSAAASTSSSGSAAGAR
jgi:putative ABC transport system ATP-binding protein